MATIDMPFSTPMLAGAPVFIVVASHLGLPLPPAAVAAAPNAGALAAAPKVGALAAAPNAGVLAAAPKAGVLEAAANGLAAAGAAGVALGGFNRGAKCH